MVEEQKKVILRKEYMDCIHIVIFAVIQANVDFLVLEPQLSPCAQCKTCSNTSNTNWLLCDCNDESSDPIDTENFFIRYIIFS